MAKDSSIEWTDSTLNLSMGCDGCELWNRAAGVKHCYAGTLTDRYGGRKGWPEKFEQPELFVERIEAALKWKDLTGTERPAKPWLNGLPRIIFLGDMGDTFTESLPGPMTWLAPLVEQLAGSPHQFLMLTKRPARMATFSAQIGGLPRNVWPGTTITTQATANSRISSLLAVEGGGPKFVSAEPLLAAVDMTPSLYRNPPGKGSGAWTTKVDWVICGGESGPGARPMHPEWARSLRDQCVAAGVPFFFKQGSQANWESFTEFTAMPIDLQIREFPYGI